MKKLVLFLSFLIILVNSSVFTQTENENCPPLFTHSTTGNPYVKITNIVVIDSNKYSSLPESVLSKDSLSKLFYYPEIARRAGIEGEVIVKAYINNDGEICRAEIIKGIGGGCDEAVLDVLLKMRLHPAKIMNENVKSEIIIIAKFQLYDKIDKPNFIFDEIIYVKKGFGYHRKLTLKRSNQASIYEVINQKIQPYKSGKIPEGLYVKLNDFIISECFLDYNYTYSNINSVKAIQETVIVKIGPTDKSVTTYGFEGDPVGLWAMINILRHIDDQIKWEEVKE